MNIIVKVPDSVILFCKNKNLTEEQISALYSVFLGFMLNESAHEDHPFFEWFEENGSDAIDEL